MTFDDYQLEAGKTAVYPDIGKNFIYPTMGLAGEAGEVAGKLSKVVRGDTGGVVTEEVRQMVSKELGDVLWFVAQLATELNLSLGDIADANVAKLRSRQERGVLKGDGDTR